MPISSEELIYDFSEGDCSASGVSLTSSGLDAAIGDIADSILYDDPGRAVVDSIISGLHESDFDRFSPQEFLTRMTGLQPWRVGEAVARLYLTVHRACLFPWPPEWDRRRIDAISAGPDLVGLLLDGSSPCFAFGEVKTSSDPEQPPRVMRGSDGLVQQLRELRGSKVYRDSQVAYLARRAEGTDWFEPLEAAFVRYLKDDLDVRLFGCLIRDVEPSWSDLRRAVAKLASSHPRSIAIELLAIYLPKNRIHRLGHDLDEALRRVRP